MSNVSAMAARRTRRNAHDDERYAKLLSLLAGAGVDDTPLGVYLVEEWLPRHQLDVEPTTFRAAEDAVYNFIVPQLGQIPVYELSRDHLRAFHQVLLRTEMRKGRGLLSKTTVIRIHATLSSALQRLVEAGRIPANPAWGSRPRVKKSERYEPVIWSPEHLCRFLEFVADDDLHALWSLLALGGVRRGEALGVQWGDLATRFTHVTVKRSVCEMKGGTYVTAPKASQARRVDLVGETIRALRSYRRRQLRRARSRGGELRPSDFIFTRPSGEELSPNGVTRRFGQLAAKAGLPRLRLHDLRHTHASHLLEAGGNLKAVQERLGHSDPAFTIRSYVHAAPTIQREAVKSLEALYRSVGAEG